jgi:hypothetical protein
MVQGVKEVQTALKEVSLSDAEYEEIKPFLLNPGNIEKTKLRSFHADLANNWPDRSKERFGLGIIQVFAKTLVEKSVLFQGHEWGPPGDGIWYKSTPRKITREEFNSIITFKPSKAFLKQIDFIEGEEGLYVLDSKFYTLASNPNIERLDAGIMRWMSLGFRADGINPVNDQKGLLMYREYFASEGGVSEALEGSFVFLGDQIGARTRKALQSSPTKGVTFMNLFFKSVNLGITVDPENVDSVKMLETQVNAKFELMAAEVNTANENLVVFKTALGNKDLTIEEAGKILADAKLLREQTIEEAVKFGIASGMIAKDQADIRRNELKAMSIAQARMFLDTYKKVWQERNPGKGTLEEVDPETKATAPGNEKGIAIDSDY